LIYFSIIKSVNVAANFFLDIPTDMTKWM